MEYEHLIPFATEIQRKHIQAVLSTKSKKEAAEKLGINSSSLYRSLNSAKKKYKESLGLDGAYVGATSTLMKGGADDEFALRWIKARDSDVLQLQEVALEAFVEKMPKTKPVKQAKSKSNKDLINQYLITDFHLGLLAHKEDTGDDWNSQLAVDTLIKWFEVAIEKSPPADECIFLQLGDMLHFDSLDSVTPLNKHVLDADCQQHMLIKSAIMVHRKVVELLLKKYKKVNVFICEGNHDLSSSIWLREAFRVFYEDEPRVYVDGEVKPYYCFKWGKTGLFYHHGHMKAKAQIDRVMAGFYPELFGSTTHRYCAVGHYHHDEVKETNLMKVEQHRTLSGKDNYAVRGGYLSGRDSKVITYSKQFGEVSRLTISFDMIQ